MIVLHELFGAAPTLFQFAHRIADAGFEFYARTLFGDANHEATVSRGRCSPITDWVWHYCDTYKFCSIVHHDLSNVEDRNFKHGYNCSISF